MAITRVQKRQLYISSSGAFSSGQTAGNLVIIEVQGYSYNGTPATITCTSTGADTPIKATQALGPNFGAGKILWYVWDCEAGTPTYSVGGVPDDCSVTLYEYAGVDASADPLIDADSITNSTANPLGVTLTTEANGLLFFSWGDEVSLSFSSMNTGATLITFDTSRYMADAENLSTSAGTTTVNANVSPDVDSMIVAASFREAGGGGGTNDIEGSASLSLSVSGTIRNQSKLSGTAAATFSQTGTIRNTAKLTGVSSFSISSTASIRNTSKLSGTSSLSITPSGTIRQDVKLTGTTTLSIAGSAVIRNISKLTGSGTIQITGTGNIANVGVDNITGSASFSISASGNVRANIRLIGSTQLLVASTAVIRNQSKLTGTGQLLLSASGNISATHDISGNSSFLITATGTMNRNPWNGSVIDASTIGPSAINGQNGNNNNSVIQQQGTGNSVIT